MKLLYIILLALFLSSMTFSSNNKREKFRKKHSLRIVLPKPENIIIEPNNQPNNRIYVTYETDQDWSLFKVIVIAFAIGSGIECYKKFFHSTQESRR